MAPPSRMAPKDRRRALEQLSRERLAELTDIFGLEVEDRRVIDDHISALVRSRRIDFGELLRQLKREELQDMCEALSLDDGGREKSVLIERILRVGDGSDEEEPAPGRPSAPIIDREPVPRAPVSWGIATPIAAGPVEPLRMRTDGRCVTETVASLQHGFGGKPMPRDAVERVRRQAEDVLGEILTSYASDVAAGEVGVILAA